MAEDNSTELTDFEAGLLEWLCEKDFHAEPWSRKVPQRIQVFYKNGALHIAAD